MTTHDKATYLADSNPSYRICAYCAERATHEVANELRTLVGWCCDEPTHWAWLVESIKEVERSEKP